ncbi:MAG: undecaprenyl-diphosphate phosphatase [Candidatus Scalinduaceae bacterium]
MIIQSIILGIVQGLTEFLPVSSSGHLVIFKSYLGADTQGVIWEVSLHFGTLLAILGVFFRDILEILKSVCLSCKKIVLGERLINIFRNDNNTRVFFLVVIGTIPTALIAFFFRGTFESLFNKPVLAGLMLLVTGTVLWFTRRYLIINSNKEELGICDALVIGTVQGLAIAPGISRSGTTIAAATFRGVDRGFAAKFSFLLAIPAILGAMAMILKDPINFKNDELSFLVTGSIVAAVTGYVSLRFLIKIVTAGKLYLFSYYCWPVGLFAILFFL